METCHLSGTRIFLTQIFHVGLIWNSRLCDCFLAESYFSHCFLSSNGPVKFSAVLTMLNLKNTKCIVRENIIFVIIFWAHLVLWNFLHKALVKCTKYAVCPFRGTFTNLMHFQVNFGEHCFGHPWHWTITWVLV